MNKVNTNIEPEHPGFNTHTYPKEIFVFQKVKSRIDKDDCKIWKPNGEPIEVGFEYGTDNTIEAKKEAIRMVLESNQSVQVYPKGKEEYAKIYHPL